MMFLSRSLVQLRYVLSARYRRRRYAYFWQKVGRKVQGGLWLDLGGGPGSYFLSHFPDREKVVLVDLDEPGLRTAQAHFGVECVVANGECLPFRDHAFACIFCNSVIEHVPHPQALAAEIMRTGQSYFVQTPNGRFPFEPHSAIPIPLYRYLPRALQRLAAKLSGASFEYLASVSYLSVKDLRRLFPSATVERERVLGLTKSFYVFRTDAGDRWRSLDEGRAVNIAG